jgi:hypothetical protein
MMSIALRAGVAGLAALLLAGCEEQPELVVNTSAAAKPPEQACAQVRQGIETLRADAGLEADGKGGATIMEEAWLRLDGGTKDQMVQLLGVDAACRAEQPSPEQKVTIRSEYGRVMVEQTVSTAGDSPF